jgi:hypothetical protein
MPADGVFPGYLQVSRREVEGLLAALVSPDHGVLGGGGAG